MGRVLCPQEIERRGPLKSQSSCFLQGQALEYLTECLKSGWVSGEGPFVQRFEEAFARRVNRQHGVAVSSGSAALDVAVKALGIGPGDEVIMPAFTIISPALSVIRQGARPVLVDADPLTWNRRVEEVESKVTRKTKAILVFHVYGLPTDMQPILDTAARHGLAVIEDAAQMHGQTYLGRPCGSFGDISTFSFYANKLVTTGEGGMILVNDAGLARRCREISNLCFQAEQRFVHEDLGWNYRMSNLQAALGLAQLEDLDSRVEARRHWGSIYAGAGGASRCSTSRRQDFLCRKHLLGFWSSFKAVIYSEYARPRPKTYRFGDKDQAFFLPYASAANLQENGTFSERELPHCRVAFDQRTLFYEWP